jgi:hypothetical protein
MDLTLLRRPERRAARVRRLGAVAGPAGVLTAATLLSLSFLAAVADLVTRLG